MTRNLLWLALAVACTAQLQSQDHRWRQKGVGSITSVGVNPMNSVVVYVHNNDTGQLLASYDKGLSWAVLGYPGSSFIKQIACHPADSALIFCVGNGLHRSADYGTTWTDVLPQFSIDGESLVFDPVHPDTMFGGNFSDGAVYRSTDGGITWEFRSYAGQFLCALALRPDSTNILYAGTGGGTISKSTDEGLSWKVVPTPPSVEVPHISIDPLDPQRAYATVWSVPEDSARGVWITLDGGETWTVSSLSGVSTWAMDTFPGPEHAIYAGIFEFDGPMGAFRSSDQGGTWDLLDEGLPTGTVAWSLKVSQGIPDFLWLAAGQQGIYRWTPSLASVTGTVRSAETNELVTNGILRVTATGDSVNLGETGGSYAFHYYEGDPSLTAEVHLEAFPFYPRDIQLHFVLDSSITHDIYLTTLPSTVFSGMVQDSLSQDPVQALVTVTAMTVAGAMVYQDTTSPQGTFEFASLYITHPPIIDYTEVRFEPAFPHAVLAVQPFFLDSTITVLNVDIDTADVLITSSPGSGDYDHYYGGSLTGINLTYHTWNPEHSGIAPFGRGVEMRKRTIVFFTGDKIDPLSQGELDSLEHALTRGVNIFISGQNFVEANAPSSFVSQILGLGHAGVAGATICRGIEGEIFSGSFIITSSGDGADNQTSRDILQPLQPTPTPVIDYGVIGNEGTAAVRLDSVGLSAKVILFGFGFEAISGQQIRQSTMQTIVGYFDGSIIVGLGQEPESDLPLSYELLQNYPNPFNAQTTIRFALPDASDIDLAVFNLLGERVATLASGPWKAGAYEIQWDGIGQPSGVYFFRMGAGGFMKTRKLLLVR